MHVGIEGLVQCNKRGVIESEMGYLRKRSQLAEEIKDSR